MLDDELREMFGTRVQTPPAATDPAGAAIKHGRRRARRRRAAAGAAAAVAFAAMLGGAGALKGIWTPSTSLGGSLTYEGLFGRNLETPARSNISVPIMSLPIDVYVGTALWTADGRRLSLSGVDQVLEVVRVPAGWLYSDDIRLRLLTLSGSSVPIRANVAAWGVSPDGTRVATVAEGTVLEVHQPGKAGSVKTIVPAGTQPVTFDGTRVVLQHNTSGFDLWTTGSATYRQTWNSTMLAVYTSAGDTPVALVQEEDGTVCLVDLTATDQGWQAGSKLGCGEIFTTAARGAYGRASASRSPDGRWLAVPSAQGVQLLDIHASRASTGSAAGLATGGPTCDSAPDAPVVWADAHTLLTISDDAGIVACGINGSRHSVPLPAGVTEGWALVPRYGVIG